MSFDIYIIGYIVLIVGLGMGAHLLHVPARWIAVGIVCMMGIGILTGVATTRHRVRQLSSRQRPSGRTIFRLVAYASNICSP